MGILDKVFVNTQKQKDTGTEHELNVLTVLTNFTENIEARDYDAVNQVIDLAKGNMDHFSGLDELLTRITNVIQCSESYYKTRLEMVSKSTEAGLWEMDVRVEDPIHPDNEFRWSPEFRAMLGYQDEKEFPNRFDSWSKLLHPDEEEEVLGKFIDHLLDLTGSTKFDAEYRLLTKKGKYNWYRATGTTIRDKHGQPIMIAGVMFDIDERKRREEELQRLVIRAKLVNQVLHEAPWEIQISWPNPLDPQKEVWWSDRFRTLLGYKGTQDFPGLVSSWLNSIHPDDYARAVSAVEKHLSDLTGNTEYDITYRLRTKMGDYRLFHIKGHSERNEEGVPIILAGTIQDVTRDVNKEHVMELVKFHMEELLGDIKLL